MNLKKMRIPTLVAGALAAVGLVLTLSSPVAATPIVITQIGTSSGNPGGLPVYEVSGLMEGDAFNVDWLLNVFTADGDPVEISATGMVTVTTLETDNVVLDIMLTNTSSISTPDIPNLGIRFTVFGLEADGFTGFNPPTTPADGTYLVNRDFSNFPGFGSLACATAGGNCAGGGGGGIVASSSDMFTMDMAGTFDTDNLVLSQFAAKFQTGFDSDDDGSNDDSFELPGVPSEKPGTDRVPEPSSMLLLGLGLAGLGFWGRKRGRRTS